MRDSEIYQAQLTKLLQAVEPGEGSPEQHPPAVHIQHAIIAWCDLVLEEDGSAGGWGWGEALGLKLADSSRITIAETHAGSCST